MIHLLIIKLSKEATKNMNCSVTQIVNFSVRNKSLKTMKNCEMSLRHWKFGLMVLGTLKIR